MTIASCCDFQSRRILPTHYAFWFGPPYNPVVTILSPTSSPSKKLSNPTAPDETPASPLKSTSNPPTTIPDVAFSLLTGLHFSICLPENGQSEITQELPAFNSILSDVRPLLLRANHLKFHFDHSVLGRQHRREYYTNRARRTKRYPLQSTFTIQSQTRFLYMRNNLLV